jgi:putative phosphoribosyl transferase
MSHMRQALSRPFRDRVDAGQTLATHLRKYARRPDVLVLALPRGGVPVAYEVAKALDVPLDVFIVRKLGVPGHDEYAMGAVASGGIRVISDDVVRSLGLTDADVERVAQRELAELDRREQQYRGDRPEPQLHEKTIILIDDGLATGSTMKAAVKAIAAKRPGAIVVAVPIAAPETCRELADVVHEVVCAVTPEPFHAVGLWYDDFRQTTDEEVHDLLEKGRR